MKIVAIDFETANSNYQSICALGISIYEDGEIKDSFEWFIKPHKKYNYFTNSMIHKIYPKDVKDKPEFNYYYNDLVKILDNSVVVAHNTSFDINVLNKVCNLYGYPHFEFEYFDTVDLSRKVFPNLKNHKLDTVAEYMNVDLKHHDGQSDSFACLMIVLNSMTLLNTFDYKELIKKTNINLKMNK